MNRILIAAAGLVAFLSGAQGAWAFTTQPVSPETMSNRLADPDELADKMSNGQSGGTTFGVPGGHMMLQFSAPPSTRPYRIEIMTIHKEANAARAVCNQQAREEERTYAISRPRTRCRCFWYGNAEEITYG